MAPFSIPAPCIVPLRTPFIGPPKTIDTITKIELLCDTPVRHEIFYTLDGTRPQPYAGIVQGSKIHRYTSPFTLLSGKVTVKAIAINKHFRNMCSNVVTKCFEVVPAKVGNLGVDKNSEGVSKRRRKRTPGEGKEGLIDDFEGREELNLRIGSLNMNGQELSDHHMQNPPNDENELVSSDNESVSEDLSELETVNSRSIANSELLEDASRLIDVENPESATARINGDSPANARNGFLGNGFMVTSSPGTTLVGDLTEDVLQVDDSGPISLLANGRQLCCTRCSVDLQKCPSCHAANSMPSKFCIQCGEKLAKTCVVCKEANLIIAIFCQFCGRKLDFQEENETNVTSKNLPLAKDVFVQASSSLLSSSAQTSPAHFKSRMAVRRNIPPQSPGRGFWRQQLDYVCNHLKTHAYNNEEFRESISEPILKEFRSANATPIGDDIIITVVFSALPSDKSTS